MKETALPPRSSVWWSRRRVSLTELCGIRVFARARARARYDDLTQATTGIMARFGGSLEHAEEHAHIGTVDVVTGFAGVFATCLALLRRSRTGEVEPPPRLRAISR